MNARDALLSVEEVVRSVGDRKAVSSFYLEFGRRLEVLRLVEEYCKRGSRVLDVGASPFITSCALKRMGYEVVALDVEPEPYTKIAKSCGVSVVKCDLEKDELNIGNADCVVFAEVLEHLHYYYAPSILAKINKALKVKGILILTTPNVASLFRRLRLLLGKQPIYRCHVREYTMEEVLALVEEAGFDIVKAYYSIVNDLTYIDAEPDDYLRLSSYRDLVRVTIRRHTRLNVLRALAYPVMKLRPSLRQLVVVVGAKSREPLSKSLERW
jgi:2-polyprenyl-3-methyl-5-hydroxy-6-metoxy-1,4-benzoquinol methylase